MPKLILVNGPCGVGKTTFAKELQKHPPRSLLVEGDELRRWFEEHPTDRAASAERLTELIIQIASAQLSSGHTVIFDKTIVFDGVVHMICSEVGEDNVIELVLMLLDAEVHRRVKARGGHDELLTQQKVQQFIDYFKDYDSGAKYSITLDATQLHPTDILKQINHKTILT